MVTVPFDVAQKGDSVEERDLPGTTVKRGWGWVRTFDRTRTLHVQNVGGVWKVLEVETVARA
jgi:hypothetical protein